MQLLNPPDHLTPVIDTISCRLLKLRDVEGIVAMGKSSIYRKMDAGTFPKPVSLGMNTVRWKLSDIQAWINDLKANESH